MADLNDRATAELDRAAIADVLRQLADAVERLPVEHGSAPFNPLRPHLKALQEAIMRAAAQPT